MKVTAFAVLAVALAAPCGAQKPAPSSALTFRTGAAEAPVAIKTVLPFAEDVYHRAVRSDAGTVAISRAPRGLSDHALYGYNFILNEKNCGWIVDGDDEHGWRLYIDWKGDGDLSQTKALSFNRVDGTWRLDVDVPDGDLRWPCRFEVTRLDVGGVQKVAVKIGDMTIRRGVIVVGGKSTPFAVRGTSGRYGRGDYSVSIDRGAGEYESYKRSEGYFNLFGKSYAFSVDLRGDMLTLEELAELRPDRPTLKPGTAAPEFSAADIDGVVQSVAKYRGRMLLVEFWSTSCGPCREEMPQMVRFFNETAQQRVAFLGVAADASEKVLRDFLGEFRMAWPQIREASSDGPLQKLYRVNGWPTYFLLGPQGEILDAWSGSELAEARIKKFLQPQ